MSKMAQELTGSAAVYARVSTERQADNDRVSLPDQIQRCKSRCLVDNFSTSDELTFQDTTSGTKDETGRPGFAAMLKAAEEGRFTRLYVLALDRLARDLVIGVKTLERLEKLGIEFVSILEPGVENVVVRNLLLTLSQEERRKIVQRTTRGKRVKRADGRWVSGAIPYGHRRGADMTLALDPDEAAVARRIFRDVIDGRGRIAIAKALNAEGVSPPYAHVRLPGQQRSTRVRLSEIGGLAGLEVWLAARPGTELVRAPRWTEGVLDQIIRNSIYCGHLAGDEATGLAPARLTITPAPVVSETAWKQAQEAAQGRYMKGAAPRKPQLLSGMIKCGQCGRSWVYHAAGTTGDCYAANHRYICTGRRTGNGCTCPTLRRDDADTVVVEKVVEFLTKKLAGKDIYAYLISSSRQAVESRAVRLSELESSRAALEEERRTALLAAQRLAGLGLSDADLQDLAAQVKRLTPEIEAARREIDEIHAALARDQASFVNDAAEAREAARFAEDAIASLSAAQPDTEADPFGLLLPARTILHRLVREVIVSDQTGSAEDRISVCFNDGEDVLARLVAEIAGHALAASRRVADAEVDAGDRVDGADISGLEEKLEEHFKLV